MKAMREPIEFTGAFLIEHADIARRSRSGARRKHASGQRRATRPAGPKPRANARGCGRS
jgi:hypothetical protein